MAKKKIDFSKNVVLNPIVDSSDSDSDPDLVFQKVNFIQDSDSEVLGTEEQELEYFNKNCLPFIKKVMKERRKLKSIKGNGENGNDGDELGESSTAVAKRGKIKILKCETGPDRNRIYSPTNAVATEEEELVHFSEHQLSFIKEVIKEKERLKKNNGINSNEGNFPSTSRNKEINIKQNLILKHGKQSNSNLEKEKSDGQNNTFFGNFKMPIQIKHYNKKNKEDSCLKKSTKLANKIDGVGLQNVSSSRSERGKQESECEKADGPDEGMLFNNFEEPVQEEVDGNEGHSDKRNIITKNISSRKKSKSLSQSDTQENMQTKSLMKAKRGTSKETLTKTNEKNLKTENQVNKLQTKTSKAKSKGIKSKGLSKKDNSEEKDVANHKKLISDSEVGENKRKCLKPKAKGNKKILRNSDSDENDGVLNKTYISSSTQTDVEDMEFEKTDDDLPKQSNFKMPEILNKREADLKNCVKDLRKVFSPPKTRKRKILSGMDHSSDLRELSNEEKETEEEKGNALKAKRSRPKKGGRVKKENLKPLNGKNELQTESSRPKAKRRNSEKEEINTENVKRVNKQNELQSESSGPKTRRGKRNNAEVKKENVKLLNENKELETKSSEPKVRNGRSKKILTENDGPNPVKNVREQPERAARSKSETLLCEENLFKKPASKKIKMSNAARALARSWMHFKSFTVSLNNTNQSNISSSSQSRGRQLFCPNTWLMSEAFERVFEKKSEDENEKELRLTV